jgi:hypothetical protein
LNLTFSACNQAFCSEYAKKYLQGVHEAIRLLHPNKVKSWEAELEINNNRCKLGRGWSELAHDNELNVGDICLFQLMETEKLTMTVHIIRKSECT